MYQNKKKVITLSFFATIALNTPLLANEIILLDSIEVTAAKQYYSTTEEVDSYTIGSMNTSTKLDLSIKETPQNVSVITSQEMEDRQINSFHDVLAAIPGLTINNRGGDNYVSFVRGFSLNYFKIDGVPTYSTVNDKNFDPIIYDRVEIVKGANGLTTGEGDPSLAMNFIRKHANSKEVQGTISLNAGSWNDYSQSLDISAPITEDKHVRSRFIIKNEDSDAFYDNFHKKDKIFYGIVDAELGDLTILSLGATYQDLQNKGVWSFGLPAFYTDNTYTNFSRSTSLTPDWTYSNLETKEVFGSLKQYLYDDISLNLSSSFIRTNRDTNTVQIRGKINQITGAGLNYNNYSTEATFDETNLDAYLSFPFTTFGLSHEVITGFSYNERTKELRDRQVLPAPTFNFYHFTIPNALESVAFTESPDEKIEQLGSYLAGRFSLSENLKLISGIRVSDWKYKKDDPSVAKRTFSSELTPYAGLVYNLDSYHSVYVSYTDIFKPQNAKDISGSYLDPIVGKSYETGIKGEYFEGRLTTSFSLFKIVQDNVATNGIKLLSGEWAYEAAKGVTSKGFEVGASGDLTDRWSLAFGLANFSAEDAKGDKFSTNASRTTMSAFTKYKVNNELSVGGGLNYYSKFYIGSGTTYIQEGAYSLVNLMAKYQLDKHTELQLNINNLFDKTYYEGVGNGPANWYVYGAPRNAMLSMRYSF
ncbi:TonB-dependent siderophore receptor [Sulfurospirillum oryzae]|uniref:TonB-dependent siderophore receptor n=1 Tax=Sulfurospirillum oryzae TaxID=2976535 RepID=UPI0021E742E9|nr:TonB-dependent siderophore receptor [Sulfurospirillum oryzae]